MGEINHAKTATPTSKVCRFYVRPFVLVLPCVWSMKVTNPARPRTRQKTKLVRTEM